MRTYLQRLLLRKLKISSNKASFRCPFCGDSKSKPNKRSAYILGLDTEKPFFYCHRRNCIAGENNSFSEFIKTLDYNLWKEFIQEQFRKNLISIKKNEKIEIIKTENPIIELNSIKNFYYWMHPISSLKKDSIPATYLKKRKIHERHWNQIFYLVGNPYNIFNKIFKTKQYQEKWRKNVCFEGIVVPFLNSKNNAIGFGMRMLNSDGYFRYLNMVTQSSSERFFFGENTVNHNLPIIVLEGMLDKLTFDRDTQILSMISANLKLNYLKEIQKSHSIYVFDNEFLNSSINRSILKVIDDGKYVFLWDAYVKAKDINDLKVKYNWSDSNIIDFIKKNTFSGINAKLKLAERKQQQIEELIYKGG